MKRDLRSQQEEDEPGEVQMNCTLYCEWIKVSNDVKEIIIYPSSRTIQGSASCPFKKMIYLLHFDFRVQQIV